MERGLPLSVSLARRGDERDWVEPVVACRVWKWRAPFGLGSPLIGSCWRPRLPLRALCVWPAGLRVGPTGGPVLPPHRSPCAGCVCGIWACRTFEQALSTPAYGADYMVAGQVALWGKVLEDERGLRGEFAYPRTLALIEASFTPRHPRRRPLKAPLLRAAMAQLRSFNVPLACLPAWDELASLSSGE